MKIAYIGTYPPRECGIGAIAGRMGEMIRAHLHAGGLAVHHIPAEVRVGEGRAFRRLGKGVIGSARMDTGPVDRALIVRHINAEEVVSVGLLGGSSQCERRHESN